MYEIVMQEILEEHRAKMKWVFEDILNIQYCEYCDKVIIKYIYSMRRSDMICCSLECVEKLY
jgi:hypothetical protein